MVDAKKVKSFIFFLIVGMILVGGCIGTPSKNELKQKFSEFKKKYDEKQSQGYIVTGADEFIRKAKKAFDSNDYKTANKLLDEAFGALENAKAIQPSETVNKAQVSNEEARKRLSQVKVASQYRYVMDGMRSIDEAIKIIKETRTGFINLGWVRLAPMPDKCLDLPAADQKECDKKGYSYEYMRDAVSKIKKENPDVIFGTGLSAEFLNPECWNELTGEKFGKNETWNMTLDPSKWGIPISKEDAQTRVAISHGWAKKGQAYNPKEQMPYYFPDQTNQEYQKLFLSWVTKQIDSGADAILIDINTKQAKLLSGATSNVNHIAVKDSFNGTSQIVDEIHKYGRSKGKNIYVISWATVADLESPYIAQNLDAVMTTPSTDEIKAIKMDEAKWDDYIAKIRDKFGDIPVFVMFDQGPDYRPLEAFSQELSMADQQKFLRTADEFFQRKGLVFIYPIHGGLMGSEERLRVRSFGKFNWYDSLAPEFQTYETIKELALKKAAT